MKKKHNGSYLPIRSQEELEVAFQKVKQNYFPRWDRAGEWKIKKMEMHFTCGKKMRTRFFQGRCEPWTKTIFIVFTSNIETLEGIIIHEVCHAIAGTLHTNRWKERMLKVIEIAPPLLRHELVQDVATQPLESWREIQKIMKKKKEELKTKQWKRRSRS